MICIQAAAWPRAQTGEPDSELMAMTHSPPAHHRITGHRPRLERRALRFQHHVLSRCLQVQAQGGQQGEISSATTAGALSCSSVVSG